MARKTIAVDYLRERANGMLADSADHVSEARRGVAHLLERVLMDTGNYHGFQYLRQPKHEGDPREMTELLAAGEQDETRRRYF